MPGQNPSTGPRGGPTKGGGGVQNWPKAAQNRPKTAKNGQKRPRKAPRGPRARVMTPRSPSGAHRTQFWHLSNPQRPLHRLFRPILGRFGPNRGATDGPGVKSEKWPYRSPDVPNRDFEGTILGCNPPVWVVSTPQNGSNARLGPRKWPVLGPKMVQNSFAQKSSRMLLEGLRGIFGPFGVHFGPLLARFQAPFGPETAARSEQFGGPASTHARWRGV